MISDKKDINTQLGLVLILISSVLLGVWAVKDTIALRNIMLFLGAPLGLFYCYQAYQLRHLEKERIDPKYLIPIICLFLMFAWVLLHYLFFSRFPEVQFQELRSTWLRTLLGVVIGLAAGMVASSRPYLVNLLWLGVLPSFAYLYYQYLQKASSVHSLFAPDYNGYIFYGKISGVLVGTILIAGLLGTLLDLFPSLKYRGKWLMTAFWLLGTSMALYSYVFIFDARNGVGLALLLFSVVAAGLLIRLGFSIFLQPNPKKIASQFLFLICLIGVGGWFGMHQVKLNPGWSTMIEDTQIAVQVHQYPNWQNPTTLGFPLNSLGKEVRGNTYERVSWAVAGLTILAPEAPLGVGILIRPFGVLLNEMYPDSAKGIMSSHSAWVELTLAFGFIGLALTLGALISVLLISITTRGPFHYLVQILAFTVICLYALGEVSSQHGIEILYFLIALMTGLLIPQSQQNCIANAMHSYRKPKDKL